MDLIDRQALLKQIEIDSDGEPGYYGDTWKFIDTIKSMPPAELGANLAGVDTDVPDKNVGELISRQSAVDELVKMLSNCFYADEEVLDAVETTLKELPSAHPEIIRCKDCKYWDTTWQNDYAPNYHYCPMIDSTRRNDFYCADAERRTDG